MMPHASEKGNKEIQRMLADLDDMQSYLDPNRRIKTTKYKEQMKAASRRKLGEVLNFLAG